MATRIVNLDSSAVARSSEPAREAAPAPAVAPAPFIPRAPVDEREPNRIASRFAGSVTTVLAPAADNAIATAARAAAGRPPSLEAALAGRSASDVKLDPVTQVVDIYHGASATAVNNLQRITTSGLNGCGVGVVVTESAGIRTAQLAHFPDLAAGRMLETMKSLMPRLADGARTEIFFLTGARRFSDSALQGLVKGVREHFGDVPVKTDSYATRGGASSAEGYGTVTLEIPPAGTGSVRVLGWEKEYVVMADTKR